MAAGRTARCWAAMLIAGMVCGVLASTARAQEHDDLARLVAEVSWLHGQGKYAEAISMAERAVALAGERHGEEHTEFASVTNWLARVYHAEGRYAEAEPSYKRSLAIREKALGPEHADVGAVAQRPRPAVRGPGPLCRGRAALPSAASPSGRRPWSRTTLTWRSRSTTWLCCTTARAATPRPSRSSRRSLAIREKALGLEHPDVGTSLNNLARLYQSQGRYAEAEPLFRRSLAIREKALGPEHPDVGTALNNLAVLYYSQGRYAEAEPLSKRSLAITEKALGPEHSRMGRRSTTWPSCTTARAATPRPSRCTGAPRHPREGAGPRASRMSAPSLNNLAALYQAQGRYAEAEPLYKRSLAIREKALGPEHPDVGTVAQQPGRAVPGPGPLRRGRAALQAQPRHPREGAGARPPRRRHLAQQPGRAVPGPGPLRRGRAALQAQPRHPREGAGARAPRRRHVAQQPGRAVPRPRAATPRPSRSTSAASPSARRRWGPTTPTSARRSTTWPGCTRRRAATPRPSRSTSAASPSARRRWGPSTPTSPRRSTTWPSCTRPRAATPRPSRSTSAASPSARRRWGPTTPTWPRRSTTWPRCTRPRAATPRPSRSTSAASPSPRRRWGPSTPTSAPSLNNLAALYRAQGRYAEAEPLYQRSLAIREKALGPDHPDVGAVAQQPGRAVPGPGPLRRGRAALQAQPRHPREGAGARAPRRRHVAQQPGRAVPGPGPLRRGRAALSSAASPSARRRWGPTTPTSARSLNNLAVLYRAQGRYAEAEPLVQAQPRHPREGAGARPPRRRHVAQQPGRAVPAQGRYAEAEPLYKRSLAIREKALGPDHPDVGTSLNNLAGSPSPSATGRGLPTTGGAAPASSSAAPSAASPAAAESASEGRGAATGMAVLRASSRRPTASRRRAALHGGARSGDVRDGAVGARLGGRGLAGADGGAVGQGLAAAGRPGARAAGPGERMAGEGQAAHRRQERGAGQAQGRRREGARRPPRRHRHAPRRDRPAARPGLPGLRRAGEPGAPVRRGGAGPARRRRGPGAVPRHARVEAAARGDLHLGRDQDGRALGALRPRHGGAHPRGGGAALRPRCDGVGRRRGGEVRQGPGHPARQGARPRPAAALRSRPRPQALHGAVRRGRRT